ncbi:TPA: ester cyclase, partial [Escherichia coli]|nr:ester cyclase [Escherichia coli]HCD2810131.1 ester cyclase [Escherichia coli]HCS6613495.1 ester cyclase [Escherichia coli]HDL0384034.1 ester cyclase [Escherichia coli]HDW1894732.1 ester cyclase [Escherichia coli]
DFLTLKSLCSSDFVFYSQIDNPIHGVDGFIASETATLDGFRGFSMKPEVLISEADKVVAYVVFEGIHNNEMHGYKPTGKKVRISLMMLLTIEGGKIKEKRAHFDYNDIVRQIS